MKSSASVIISVISVCTAFFAMGYNVGYKASEEILKQELIIGIRSGYIMASEHLHGNFNEDTIEITIDKVRADMNESKNQGEQDE